MFRKINPYNSTIFNIVGPATNKMHRIKRRRRDITILSCVMKFIEEDVSSITIIIIELDFYTVKGRKHATGRIYPVEIQH